MAKFIMVTLSLFDNIYFSRKGNKYLIRKGEPFEVNDKDDIEQFKKDKGRFEEVGIAQEVKTTTEKIVERIKKKGKR